MSAALPKLAVLLLHLGACAEAVAWAGQREITVESLAECKRPDWLSWLAAALKIGTDEPAQGWIRAAKTALLGDGDGNGYGYGYGYGNGNGDGDGNGYGYGYGNGNGNGYGYGYGYGDGDGNGNGDGNGYGYGYGYGYGNGYGYGYGNSDCTLIAA